MKSLDFREKNYKKYKLSIDAASGGVFNAVAPLLRPTPRNSSGDFCCCDSVVALLPVDAFVVVFGTFVSVVVIIIDRGIGGDGGGGEGEGDLRWKWK